MVWDGSIRDGPTIASLHYFRELENNVGRGRTGDRSPGVQISWATGGPHASIDCLGSYVRLEEITRRGNGPHGRKVTRVAYPPALRCGTQRICYMNGHACM